MALEFRSHVSTARTEYGTVLLDEDAARYWNLNQTGTLTVGILAAGGTPEQAAAALTERFDVDASQALHDVLGLLEELRAAGLVTP